MTTTRDSRFCKWLRHLGAAFLGDAEDNVEENISEEEGENVLPDFVDEDVVDGDVADEFMHLNLTGGVDTIADEDIFVLADGAD
jgi:hypothetical protein